MIPGPPDRGWDPAADPLIVSGVLAEDAQCDLDEQRRRWFLADRRVRDASVPLAGDGRSGDPGCA